MGRKTDLETSAPNGKSMNRAGHWLIVGRENTSRTLILCSELRGETLPVFSSEEDVGTFLAFLGAFSGGFVPRRATARELAALPSDRWNRENVPVGALFATLNEIDARGQSPEQFMKRA